MPEQLGLGFSVGVSVSAPKAGEPAAPKAGEPAVPKAGASAVPKARAPVAAFVATHVLAYEDEGRMREVAVRLDGAELLTAEEWAAHAVPDWTFEDDGRLYYCGVDYALERGKCGLRAVGSRGVNMEMVLRLVKQGRHSIADVALALRCSLEEVSTAIATLERLGKLEYTVDPDRVSPVFDGGPHGG